MLDDGLAENERPDIVHSLIRTDRFPVAQGRALAGHPDVAALAEWERRRHRLSLPIQVSLPGRNWKVATGFPKITRSPAYVRASSNVV